MCGGAYLGVGERYPCESVRHARDSTAKFVGAKCTHFQIKSVLNVVGLCAYGGAVVCWQRSRYVRNGRNVRSNSALTYADTLYLRVG